MEICWDPIAAFQYQEEFVRKDGARHISEVYSRRTGDDSHKQTGDALTRIKGKKINVKTVKHWNRLPREATEPSSLEKC